MAKKSYITAEEFKKLRKQIGASQVDLIKLLKNECGVEVSKATISMIESGNRKCATSSELYKGLTLLVSDYETKNPDFKSDNAFSTKPIIRIVDPNKSENYVNCSTAFEFHILIEAVLPETTQIIVPDENGYINVESISISSDSFIIAPNYMRNLIEDIENGNAKLINTVFKDHEKKYYEYVFYHKEDALDFIMDNVLTIYDIQNVLHGIDIYTAPLSLPTNNNGLNFDGFRIKFRKLGKTNLDETAAYLSIKRNFEKWSKKTWSSANGDLPLLIRRGLTIGKFKGFAYVIEPKLPEIPEASNVPKDYIDILITKLTPTPLIVGYADIKHRSDYFSEIGAMSVYSPLQDGYHIGSSLLKFMRLYSMEKGLWLCTSEKNTQMLNVLKRMDCFHQFKFVDENGISSNRVVERFDEAGALNVSSLYFCSDSLLKERKDLGFVPEKTQCGY